MAMHVELDPGTYRLRVDGQSAGEYEMFITLCKGWQTQVFQTIEQFPSPNGPVYSAALHSASILMARMGRGFDPSRPDLRLTELAKQALARGQNVVDMEAIHPMLTHEYGNPLLGLYAAHLILQQRTPRSRPGKLLYQILDYLESADGIPGHPDIQALRIAIAPKAEQQRMRIEVPPMIRAGWDYVIEATRLRDDVVPRGSLAANAAPNIIASQPWLLFDCSPTQPVQVSSTSAITSAKAKQDLKKILSMNEAALLPYLEYGSEHRKGLSNIQLSLIQSVVADNSFMKHLDWSPQAEGTEMDRANALFNSLPSPSGATATAIVDLSNRLKDLV